MTRKLLYTIFPLILLVFISNANAQAVVTTGSVESAATKASNLKLQVQQLRDQRKTTVQAAKEEFKARLLLIKDQVKQKLVERIDGKITQVNLDKTTKFILTLDRLQAFVDKFGKMATGTAALADVAAAQTAINTARTAVETQKLKIYTITITSDTALKINVGVVLSQFRRDLISVYKLVVDAKQAVQKLNTDKGLIKREASSSAKL
jgi:hypothetical protein